MVKSSLSERMTLTKEELGSLDAREILNSHLDVLGGSVYPDGSLPPSSIARLSGYPTDGNDQEEEMDHSWIEESAIAPVHLLEALDEIIEAIPFGKKSSYLEAVAKCPELVGDVQKTAVLIRDRLEEEAAAKRLVEYWALRKYVFGPAKCFLPLTLAGALRDDISAIASSFISILPTKDAFDRTIVHFNWSKLEPAKYSISGMVRAMWYVFHAASEDPTVLSNGFVALNVFNPKDCHFMSDGFADGMVDFLNVAPFIVRAHHFCSVQANCPSVLSRTLTLLSIRDKLRARGHSGTKEEINVQLQRYGISLPSMPQELGGNVQVDQNKWLVDRMIVELPVGSHSDNNGATATALTTMPVHFPPQYETMVPRVISWVPAHRPPAMGEMSLGSVPTSTASGSRLRRGPTSTRYPERARPRVRGPGCKGDIRMDRAVHAKIENPELSLLSALIAGGFDFDKHDQPDTQVLDSLGITLSQRKNQLNRRLRKTRLMLKEKEEREKEMS
mmetsp:Transcript_13136/g.28514  ORF Transcript_13136/g.28514 Transcript_13136/m.28514 type:complete len:502 (-) Transcript_13136:168-1673(-)|eukprot:CAMPEP_0178491798 /NCGR_PEP_ID=MMETSP0696-20121128/11601_1 /TAXON_ID=265572 /ORGANISM="Extubocellulus spinifer, Strain CCMP396" /LENGTH=501 /DNA_ID=CAMNT_0020119689 /DNA_START=232 /DNA_END=1737 /DNA_ORIENTATION=+